MSFCSGITEKGSKCKRLAKNDNTMCWQHSKSPSKAVVPKVFTGARQKHGFSYEDAIKKKYGMDDYKVGKNKYTTPFDAVYKDIPVQIKSKKWSGKDPRVEFASYERQRDCKVDQFIIVLGLYKDDPLKPVKEYFWLVNNKEWTDLFVFDSYKEMKAEFNLITNLREDDARWKQFTKTYKKIWGSSRSAQLAFKRDHKTQKRIQCTIKLSQLQKFNSYSF